MVKHYLSYLLTLCTFVSAQDNGMFTNPSGTQALQNVQDNNQVWSIGSMHTIVWTSSYDSYAITLRQQNLTSFRSINLGSIYSIDNGGIGSQSYNWRVTTSPSTESQSLLVDSPVYYFVATRKNDSSMLYTSHYFNITDQPISTSTASPTSTSTSLPAANSATATSNDNSNKDALRIGLGIGLGVGLPLLLLAVAASTFVGLKLASRKGSDSIKGIEDDKIITSTSASILASRSRPVGPANELFAGGSSDAAKVISAERSRKSSANEIFSDGHFAELMTRD